MACFDGKALLFVGSFEAIGTALAGDVARISLVVCIERGETDETLVGLGFVERWIDPDALVEDKTFAVIMRAAAFLEIFEDAAIKLENIFESGAFHEGRSLLATDAAGTESDDGLILEGGGKFGDCFGEIAEIVDAGGQSVLKRAELHFVIVAGIEQCDRTTFVEPLLERGRRNARRGVAGRIDPFDAKRDDFFFDPDEHAVEGLMLAFAKFDGEIGEARDGVEFRDEILDVGWAAGDEEIDTFGAEKDRALEVPFLAAGKEMRAPILEGIKRRKLIGCNVVEHRHRARREGRYGRSGERQGEGEFLISLQVYVECKLCKFAGLQGVRKSEVARK